MESNDLTSIKVDEADGNDNPKSPPVIAYSPKEEEEEEEEEGEGVLISGILMIRTRGLVRNWKKEKAELVAVNDGDCHYQLVFGVSGDDNDEGGGGDSSLSFSPLKPGISMVQRITNRPLSFLVIIDPNLPKAPVIHASALNENDFSRWMSALKKATTTSDGLLEGSC